MTTLGEMLSHLSPEERDAVGLRAGQLAMEELKRLHAENERLRDLSAALMALLDQMPVKHPQQAERRNELRRQFDSTIHQQGAPEGTRSR